MCGIVGIAGTEPVNTRIYDTLTVLQHRGQDAAGIATTAGSRIFLRKGNGLVKDVFRTRHMRELVGHLGIGHVRYPTAGTSSTSEAQPLYVNSPYGIVLGHNGNLTNAEELKSELFAVDRRHLNTRSDSEVLLNVLAHELSKLDIDELSPEHIFQAVEGVHRRCRGAYATVAMIPGFGLIAFRDEHGIRPLCYGFREGEGGRELMIASESVAIEASGFTFESDLQPGEALAASFAHLYGLHITSLRFFTVYGPRQRPEMAIHKFARLLKQGRAIPRFGDGSTSRDYTYIDDIVGGVLGALDHLEGYQVYNLGESDRVSLSRLIELLAQTLECPAQIDELPRQAGDVSHTNADIGRAQRQIGYRPTVAIDEGIRRFCDWFVARPYLWREDSTER